MINTLTQIAPRVGMVAFVGAPRYGSPLLVEMPTQRLGIDSSGAEYIYQRRPDTRCLHRLTWTSGTRTMLDALLAFYQIAQGCKYDFTWTDHLGNNHLARFPLEQIRYKRTGLDRYNITIGLEEQIRMALVDESGTTLIDENGNVLTW